MDIELQMILLQAAVEKARDIYATRHILSGMALHNAKKEVHGIYHELAYEFERMDAGPKAFSDVGYNHVEAMEHIMWLYFDWK